MALDVGSVSNGGREMKSRFSKFARVLSISLSGVVLVGIALGCGQEKFLYIELKNQIPPSFSVSGEAAAIDFQVMELPRTKPLSKTDPYSFKGKTIWKISAPRTLMAASWPAVTYAVVPAGFVLKEPEEGPAPKLAEDKLYVAQFLNGSESATLFFELRRGKVVNVTDEVFGP